MPENPIILDIQGNDGFELEFEESEDLDFETQPYSKGDPDKSAYQVAVDNGFSGTEEEWLASLVGPEGPPGTTDWDGITNKPSINGIELVGNKTSAELGVLVRTDTTANWNNAQGFIPQKGEVIVYEDYQTKTYTVEEYGETVTKTVNIPAIKIGTGNAYVQDLAFAGDDIRDRLVAHINDMNLHVTLGEKAFWSNKINVDDAYDIAYGELEDETLVLNRI